MTWRGYRFRYEKGVREIPGVPQDSANLMPPVSHSEEEWAACKCPPFGDSPDCPVHHARLAAPPSKENPE